MILSVIPTEAVAVLFEFPEDLFLYTLYITNFLFCDFFVIQKFHTSSKWPFQVFAGLNFCVANSRTVAMSYAHKLASTGSRSKGPGCPICAFHRMRLCVDCEFEGSLSAGDAAPRVIGCNQQLSLIFGVF
jgi:hypothetical protein